ncbi:MAG: competence/damage-inducible protein A, partial [Hydrogenophaga sp.]|nr:competence/damage-inducible protein A [Hydrogenophaga sp.]
WPMIEWVLDHPYAHLHRQGSSMERSVIVMGAMEAALTPLMEQIEREYPVKVFSLPSVDHPEFGRHIELGVKGDSGAVADAFASLLAGLHQRGAELGPEMVRN